MPLDLNPICPLCHEKECALVPHPNDRSVRWVVCWTEDCTYHTRTYRDGEDAIREHNANIVRLRGLVEDAVKNAKAARAWMAGKGLL